MKNRIEFDYRSNGNKKDRSKFHCSNDTPRSSSGFEMFNKRKNQKQISNKMNHTFISAKRSQISEKDNPCAQSTNSIRSFNALQMNKNNLRKGSKGDRLDNSVCRNSKFCVYLNKNTDQLRSSSTFHKTIPKGICTKKHKHYRCGAQHYSDFISKNDKKKNLNSSNIKTENDSAQEKIQSMCQIMVDNATRLECAKCLELFIPTEFLEHITSVDGCKGSIYKDNDEKSKAVSSEDTSPMPAKGKKKVNNENNLDEINPMSERCSYSSISIKKRKSPLDRK